MVHLTMMGVVTTEIQGWLWIWRYVAARGHCIYYPGFACCIGLETSKIKVKNCTSSL